jgi:hypothetical protein
MTFVQVVEMKPTYQKQKGTATLFSCHGLHMRLQAIKLLANLTHPLKITNGQSTMYPTTHHNLLLVDI